MVDVISEDYGILYAANNSHFASPDYPDDMKGDMICWQPESLQSQDLRYKGIYPPGYPEGFSGASLTSRTQPGATTAITLNLLLKDCWTSSISGCQCSSL